MSTRPTQVEVVAIGNALVDVLADTSDEFLVEQGMAKGSMALVDTEHAEQIYASMGPGVEISGGSAANTVAGTSSLGSRAAYIGRVADDQLGAVYTHDLRAAGVRFDPVPAVDGLPTGRSLILVTPDAERTMNTYLGASAQLTADDVNPDLIRAAACTYLEGYLWDSPDAQDAFRFAAEVAHAADRLVALTLSDGFVVDRHRDTFLNLIEGSVDVLFANAVEICMLYEVEDFDDAVAKVRHHCDVTAVTQGADGSVLLRGDEIVRVPVEPVPGGSVVDTTGAGDLYAAGVLHGLATGRDLATCGRIGGLAASEVISHLGARPQTSLAAMVTAAGLQSVELPRYRTGDAALDAEVAALVDHLAPAHSPELVFEMIATALRFAQDGANRGDLKIATRALKELRYAFSVFTPIRAARKASIFGSARTKPEDPLYEQARRLAATLADRGWMVVTGAGPGIMEAGIEGAGPDDAFGVSIRLPFEASVAGLQPGDPKLVNFQYFFTRKIMFVKESDAFVLLPGGFGTLDEAFETLTLIQTGKAQPAPIVLLDVPGGTYWTRWREFVEAELRDRGYLSPNDLDLVLVTDDVEAAVAEVSKFYVNYHSMRFVGRDLVLRVRRAPDSAALARLNTDFADIVASGEIRVSGPTPREERDGDEVHLDRVVLRFDNYRWARLRRLIDALNAL